MTEELVLAGDTALEERPPLFDGEEMFPEEPVTGMFPADRAVQAITYYEGKVEDLNQQEATFMAQAKLWFDNRRLTAQRRIQFHKQAIAGYLTSANEKRIATPSGTAFFKNYKKFEYDEEQLMPWAVAEGKTRTKISLDKTAIKQHFKETGEAPPGLSVSEEQKLEIRK